MGSARLSIRVERPALPRRPCALRRAVRVKRASARSPWATHLQARPAPAGTSPRATPTSGHDPGRSESTAPGGQTSRSGKNSGASVPRRPVRTFERPDGFGPSLGGFGKNFGLHGSSWQAATVGGANGWHRVRVYPFGSTLQGPNLMSHLLA